MEFSLAELIKRQCVIPLDSCVISLSLSIIHKQLWIVHALRVSTLLVSLGFSSPPIQYTSWHLEFCVKRVKHTRVREKKNPISVHMTMERKQARSSCCAPGYESMILWWNYYELIGNFMIWRHRPACLTRAYRLRPNPHMIQVRNKYYSVLMSKKSIPFFSVRAWSKLHLYETTAIGYEYLAQKYLDFFVCLLKRSDLLVENLIVSNYFLFLYNNIRYTRTTLFIIRASKKG